MTGQIVSVEQIVDSARKAADAGQLATVCPFPDGSPPADRWRIAFYARERELRAEIEE